jgi:uncharacterized membrane protein YphA (DoxX/SURF4 family)
MSLSTAFRGGKHKATQLNKLVKYLQDNQWVELAARWILGVIFVYASYGKILAPGIFAKILYGYELFPAVLINLMAIIVPFLELVAGIALIAGFYPRSASLTVNAMLLVFITVLSVNLIRGHEFDCGCFSIGSDGQKTFVGPLIFRNVLILVLGLHVFFYRNTRKLCVMG